MLYPYTNMQELNLDWILQKIKSIDDILVDLPEEVQQAVAAIDAAKTASLEELESALQTALTAVVNAQEQAQVAIIQYKNDALTAMDSARTGALSDIDSAKTDALALLESSINYALSRIESQRALVDEKIAGLSESLPADSAQILGELAVLDGILLGNAVGTLTWFNGFYTETDNIVPIVSDYYATSTAIGGVAGRRMLLSCLSGYTIENVIYWVTVNNVRTVAHVTITDPNFVDFTFPLDTSEFCITLQNVDTTQQIDASIVNNIVTLNWPTASVTSPQCVAYVENSYTASRSYNIGDYFILGGILYRATNTIAASATITPNTNCTFIAGGLGAELVAAYGQMKEIHPDWLQDAIVTGNLIGTADTVVQNARWVVDTLTQKIKTQTLNGYISILMPVDNNTDYAFTYGRYVYFIGPDKITPIDTSPLVKIRTCNSGNASYLAICFDGGVYPFSDYIFCKGTSTEGQGDQKVTLPWLDIAPQISDAADEINSRNILYGKKWAVCGDSFTNSGGTGTTMPAGTKYAGQPYTYPWIIGTRQNMTIYKFFEGGRTLAMPATPGDFVNSLTNPTAAWYYQEIPSDADYITIYLGINDAHHAGYGSDGEDTTGEIPLGTVNDNTTATYLGAWNVVLSWLITNRPNAHIGMIITNGIAGHDEYRQGQIAIANKYGIPYIDMNGDSRTPAMLRTSNPNIAAAVKTALINKWAVNPGVNEHPNDAAQEFESTFIENFLRTL